MSHKISDKISEGREYRSMALSVDAAEEEKSYNVEGYATTFNEPYCLYKEYGYEVWEQVDPEAFAECDMTDVIMQYDHQGRVYARTSNNTLQLEEDSKGLKVTADLSGTQLGRDLCDEIRNGYTTKMSFGFHVAEDKVEWTEDRNAGTEKMMRTITKINKLYDVSAVSIPANDATEISARGYSDGVIEEAKAERLKKAEIERKRKALELKMKIMEAM